MGVAAGQIHTALGTNAPLGSPMTHKLDVTLGELADASRSIHDLADYLQRNPGALIRGKYVSDRDR